MEKLRLGDKATSGLSLKDRLLARPRRIWQGTPRHFRPALGVLYYTIIAVLLRGMVVLINLGFGDTGEFRFNWKTFGLIAAAALISALTFGVVRAVLPGGLWSPWILGQVVSWSFWGCFFAASTLDLVRVRMESALLEVFLPFAGFGFVIGIILWSRRQYAA